MSEATKDAYCDDCGGYDLEWMHECSRHKTEFCRGCSCPDCEEEKSGNDDYYDYEPNSSEFL